MEGKMKWIKNDSKPDAYTDIYILLRLGQGSDQTVRAVWNGEVFEAMGMWLPSELITHWAYADQVFHVQQVTDRTLEATGGV